jgi:hypothetical protein
MMIPFGRSVGDIRLRLFHWINATRPRHSNDASWCLNAPIAIP